MIRYSIIPHLSDLDMSKRRKFILKLAKALLYFGAPSHRIESQLVAASNILEAGAGAYPAQFRSPLYLNLWGRVCPFAQHSHRVYQERRLEDHEDLFRSFAWPDCFDFSEQGSPNLSGCIA